MQRCSLPAVLLPLSLFPISSWPSYSTSTHLFAVMGAPIREARGKWLAVEKTKDGGLGLCTVDEDKGAADTMMLMDPSWVGVGYLRPATHLPDV